MFSCILWYEVRFGDFAAARGHVARALGARSFAEAFGRVAPAAAAEPGAFRGLLGHFLWAHRRGDYVFHVEPTYEAGVVRLSDAPLTAFFFSTHLTELASHDFKEEPVVQ